MQPKCSQNSVTSWKCLWAENWKVFSFVKSNSVIVLRTHGASNILSNTPRESSLQMYWFSTYLIFTSKMSFLQTMGYLKRGDPVQLRAVFEKYASAKVDGEPYMTDEDFIVRFLQLFPGANYNKHSVNLLCGIIDQSKDG